MGRQSGRRVFLEGSAGEVSRWKSAPEVVFVILAARSCGFVAVCLHAAVFGAGKRGASRLESLVFFFSVLFGGGMRKKRM